MPPLPLTAPPKPETYRVPFIYTHTQVKALLSATARCHSPGVELSADTLRMLLILLYATGTTVDELLSVRTSDLDLRRCEINLNATACRRGRVLPISAQLRDLLSEYLRSLRSSSRDVHLLRSSVGQALNRKSLCVRFRRLRNLADVGMGPHGQTPRLQDFRSTFAVHRIKYWIASGADLNVLLPALSAYMGYARLTKAEEFLAFTPERFRSELERLAIGRARPAWKTDEALMTFLTRL
ncbi:tyrosine-type recombinase/integrase [Terriglobus roseus]